MRIIDHVPPNRRVGRISTSAGFMVLAALLHVSGPRPALAADAPSTQALHAMLPDRIRQSGFMTVVTDAHHPPFESLADDNSTMIGLEPDFWNALADRLGIKVKVVSVDFSGLIPGVQSGRYDVAFECMSDSPAREQEVSFVDYMRATTALYALADNATITDKADDLCGLRGGAQVGTDFAASLRDFSGKCSAAGKPPIAIMEYASGGAVIMALYSQRVDFVLNDRGAAAQMKRYAPRPIKIVDVGFPLMTVGAAVRKDDTALASALLAAMQRLHADGTYAAIMRKWDVSALSLERPGVDLVGGR